MSQDFLNLVGGFALTALGWFAREMWSAVNGLKIDIAKLREELPQHYVPKDDYRDDVKEIKAMLHRLFEKIDGKMDK